MTGNFTIAASNLAPFLYRLQRKEGKSYQRIVETLRLILPFFFDFHLQPDSGHLLLAWRETESDQIFTASQAADGMLRTIALVTLLLQPDKTLPDLLILDEPELGLHPYAINVIGGLISDPYPQRLRSLSPPSPPPSSTASSPKTSSWSNARAANLPSGDWKIPRNYKSGLRSTLFPNCGKRT